MRRAVSAKPSSVELPGSISIVTLLMQMLREYVKIIPISTVIQGRWATSLYSDAPPSTSAIRSAIMQGLTVVPL